jgi:hypothetical protein
MITDLPIPSERNRTFAGILETLEMARATSASAASAGKTELSVSATTAEYGRPRKNMVRIDGRLSLLAILCVLLVTAVILTDLRQRIDW